MEDGRFTSYRAWFSSLGAVQLPARSAPKRGGQLGGSSGSSKRPAGSAAGAAAEGDAAGEREREGAGAGTEELGEGRDAKRQAVGRE